MKIRIIISIFILSLFLSAHVSAKETKGVVVTIKPLHSLVSAVIGDTGEAKLLLRGNTSPHDFQLKPSQVRAMQKANVIFYIDDSFETFLHSVFENLPKHIRKFAVAQKAGLTVLAHREGKTWDEHEVHEDKMEEGDGHDSHAHEEKHHDHGHHDMHVWLDLKNARRIIKSITKELSAIYPENRNTYKANARKYIKKINMLDRELKTSLASLQDKPFIVFHDAYQYFERAYALNGVGSITFEPDESPSPNRIREMRAKLQQTGAQCVFREPQFSDRLVNTVIEGSNAKSGILDPLGVGLENGPELYINLLRNLAKNLKKCLE